MSRYYDEKRNLEYDKVEAFFARRSRRIGETGPLSVTMYQTEEMARKRDDFEKAAVLPLLRAAKTTRVLDIGCGTGRWGTALFPTVASYLGTDFSQIYVDAGAAAVRQAGFDPERFTFQRLDATALTPERLLHSGPFDLILIAGLTAFLNDKDVEVLFARVACLVAPGGVIYFREPLGIRKRLTLVEFSSAQLGDTYNAIYRSEQEYLAFIAKAFLSRGAVLEVNRPLFPNDLKSADTLQETEQRIFIVKMTEAVAS